MRSKADQTTAVLASTCQYTVLVLLWLTDLPFFLGGGVGIILSKQNIYKLDNDLDAADGEEYTNNDVFMMDDETCWLMIIQKVKLMLILVQ